jgi:adenylate cyclase
MTPFLYEQKSSARYSARNVKEINREMNAKLKTTIPEDISYHALEDQLRHEMILGEKFRLYILAIVLSVMFVISSVIYFILQEELDTILRSKIFIWIFILLGILLLRSYNLQKIIDYRLKKGKSIKPAWRYLNVIIEVSVPSILIYIISQNIIPIYAMTTPIVFFYFIFIVLSTLELDFMISLFTGTIAAVQFFLLSIYFQSQSNLESVIPTYRIIAPFIGKAGIMFLTGIVAGLVAHEIRKRIVNSYKLLEERNRIERVFGQQVSAKLVGELLKEKKEMTSKRSFVCILFLDIKDFTPFSEGKSPEQIIRYQNDIFSGMIDIINEHNGLINQFMGDGFMATFGAPISSQNDCQDAVNAALDIHKMVNEKNDQGLIPKTQIRIGIHAGEAVTGNVGTSIRKQYSITGNVVILASRLEQLNKKFDSTILISKEVYEKIKQKEINIRDIGLVNVKGRQKPIEVYQLA